MDRNRSSCKGISYFTKSLSARRAWIEIGNSCTQTVPLKSLSARRAWIEIRMVLSPAPPTMSLSARRAWIEIYIIKITGFTPAVALRKESVDRNLWWGVRKAVGSLSLSARRAWIEITYVMRLPRVQVSLSARRAWIEISTRSHPRRPNRCRSPQGERG